MSQDPDSLDRRAIPARDADPASLLALARLRLASARPVKRRGQVAAPRRKPWPRRPGSGRLDPLLAWRDVRPPAALR